MSEFDTWFEDQDFYANMRYIHGDRLFLKDGDVYRVLPVQMVYVSFNHSKRKTKDEYIALTQAWHTKGWDARQGEVDQLKAKNIQLTHALVNANAEKHELKDELSTHKIEHYEMYGRIGFAHHLFCSSNTDEFIKNIGGVLCGQLRDQGLSFNRNRISEIRGEHE